MLIDDLFPSIHDIHAGQEIVEVFGVGQHFHSINVIDIVALAGAPGLSIHGLRIDAPISTQ